MLGWALDGCFSSRGGKAGGIFGGGEVGKRELVIQETKRGRDVVLVHSMKLTCILPGLARGQTGVRV